MESLTYSFSLLSDTFAHGAYQTMNFNRPELRAPSVKGMIRWWHKALGNSEDHAQRIFGGINPTLAASVSIRVQPVTKPETSASSFMPHKGQGGGAKTAIQPGTAYQLLLTQRREPLSENLWRELRRACESWLLLGAIGQRSNRAAGSILWDDSPTTQKEFEIKSAELLDATKISFAILSRKFERNRDARAIAGDFLSDQAFGGLAPFGSANPRKPSPLKLKCVQLDGGVRLLALWDRRNESQHNLTRGVQTLVRSNKHIGQLLEEVLPKLTANI